MDKALNSKRLLLSIIIPVYNVEMYLSRCLDSIFNQNCEFKYEVIAVDDCSTDDSLNILRNYEKDHSNLKVITHFKNMKLSTARISGIKESSGDYIVHIDSDDWIISDGLNIIANEVKNLDFDVVVFNYFRSYNGKYLEKVTLFDQSIILSNKDLIKKYFLGACWNKVVKRSLHTGIIYGQEEINSEEDLLYSVELMLKASKFKLSSNYFYVYFQNMSSLTMSVDPIKFLNFKPIVLKELYKILHKYNAVPEISGFILRYFEQWVYLFIYKIHNLNLDHKYIFAKILDEFSQINELENKRLSSLKNATNSYFMSFYEVMVRFGFRLTFSIFISSLVKKIFKKFGSA